MSSNSVIFVLIHLCTKFNASKNEFHLVWLCKTKREPNFSSMKSEASELRACLFQIFCNFLSTLFFSFLKVGFVILWISVVAIKFKRWHGHLTWYGNSISSCRSVSDSSASSFSSVCCSITCAASCASCSYEIIHRWDHLVYIVSTTPIFFLLISIPSLPSIIF